LTELVVTDTIPLKHQSDKIRVLTVANLFSNVIENVIHKKSISSHFLI